MAGEYQTLGEERPRPHRCLPTVSVLLLLSLLATLSFVMYKFGAYGSWVTLCTHTAGNFTCYYVQESLYSSFKSSLTLSQDVKTQTTDNSFPRGINFSLLRVPDAFTENNEQSGAQRNALSLEKFTYDLNTLPDALPGLSYASETKSISSRFSEVRFNYDSIETLQLNDDKTFMYIDSYDGSEQELITNQVSSGLLRDVYSSCVAGRLEVDVIPIQISTTSTSSVPDSTFESAFHVPSLDLNRKSAYSSTSQIKLDTVGNFSTTHEVTETSFTKVDDQSEPVFSVLVSGNKLQSENLSYDSHNVMSSRNGLPYSLPERNQDIFQTIYEETLVTFSTGSEDLQISDSYYNSEFYYGLSKQLEIWSFVIEVEKSNQNPETHDMASLQVTDEVV